MSLPRPDEVSGVEALAAALDAATHPERVAWLRSLRRRHVRQLWGLAEGRTLTPEHFVYEDGAPRVHQGRNTLVLPQLRNFQKRFGRVGDEIVGYNHPLGGLKLVRWFQGWGPFTLVPSEDVPGEVWVDYRTKPATQHAEMPRFRRHLGPRWVVYGGMIDAMRRVSRDVTVGQSILKSFPVGVGECFVLVREP